MFSKTVLPSGLRLITVPMPSVKSVTALVMVEAGSRYETKKINGISHFLEHMAFKGTKKRPSAREISSLIDGIGGSWNAFTGKDQTGFYIKAENRHLELLLDVLSDMLLNSLFEAKEKDKERGVIIEEINMYEDQPRDLAGEDFEKLLYGDAPLGWRVSGEKKNIQMITPKEMKDYVERMYHGKSMVAGIAGSGISGASGPIEKYFGKIKTGGENNFEKMVERQERPQILVHNKKTDQAHLVLGVRSYPRGHKDKYVLGLLATILGGNMSSRLFLEVREKRGLAYYVGAGVEEFADCGYLAAAAGVRIADTDEAVKTILGEFGKMADGATATDELRRAKLFWRGKMALALEDSFKVASFYTAQELLEKKIETPEEIMKQVEAVTEKDIRRVAKDIFQDKNLNLAIIGPFTREERFEKILKL